MAPLPGPGDGHAGSADNWRLSGPSIVVCNAEDRPGLARLFADTASVRCCDCAGNCALKSCELDPEMAWRINVEGGTQSRRRRRADRCGSSICRSIWSISGFGSGGHVETDPTDPVTVYGQTMVAAEELILERMPAACILRISLPMGISFNGHAGAIDWIESRVSRSGKPATLYIDEIRTPTYTDCLSSLCEDVLARDLAGLYHAGGPRRTEPVSRSRRSINRVGGYDPELLLGCTAVGGRSHAALVRAMFRWIRASWPKPSATIRSTRGRTTGAMCRPIGAGTSNGRPTNRARPSCLPASCIAIPAVATPRLAAV